ncbi:twin-arginine translocase TatA/TatE family subunit [Streptomyces sp. NPDC048420]|uniref:twin-arginine translocase TatA/TatE family subunit n=1 Tax=Streptomyces sp. NPDC048420 TaxID=3155755 RepID=UPI0034382DF9
MFGLSELAIILIVVIAVLAVKKGPELTRAAGKSTRILKAEARAAREGQPKPQVIQGEVVEPRPAADAKAQEPGAR